MRWLRDLPFLVILSGIGALAMLVPAVHAAALRQFDVARPFLYGGVIFLTLVLMIGIATRGYRPRDVAQSQLSTLLLAYIWLPMMLAVPFDQAVRDTSYLNSWFEMVSSFTTTGATLYDTPDRLQPSLHLWRALVGWLGGFFVLLTAVAVLAPLGLGGAEVVTGQIQGAAAQGAGQIARGADQSERLIAHTEVLLPAYAGLTVLLWAGLVSAGETGLDGLILAMSTLSTSGISAGVGLPSAPSGVLGEAMIFCFLLLALTRRSLPGTALTRRDHSILRDHEVRLGTVFLIVVPLILFARHWLGALQVDAVGDWLAAAGALWGALFTTLSFLTTTGFESGEWQSARSWSGLNAPGLILLGLAMMGGGVATTAGGLKLLRVYALARHGERELDRLVHPSSIGGSGSDARRMRRQGAYFAWISFMLLAMTFAIILGLLALNGEDFERSLVLAVAAVTTTGPLTALASEAPIRLLDLSSAVKIILAAAMVIGRVEILAILALLSPAVWRR